MKNIKKQLGTKAFKVFVEGNPNIKSLLPAQKKAIDTNLLKGENLLICTPTASGKTLIAELAGINHIINNNKKILYIVPLKALASEKYKELNKKYQNNFKIGVSSGDLDSSDIYLRNCDFIITTSEKFDSLVRHNIPWLHDIGLLVVDEIHLLNDSGRGPTLEVIIVLVKKILKNLQILGLSATIGNPEELANWLSAKVVIDTWRPIKLEKGIYSEKKIEFYEHDNSRN